MLRIIFLHAFLISAIVFQNSRFVAGQQGDQGNQQQGNQDNQQQGNQDNQQNNNQNGGGNDKKDPKYYCDGFEITCPIKKIRLVLHKIRTAVTPNPDGFHFPEFKMHNPFGGNNSGDDKNNNNNGNNDNNKDNSKQNGDQQGSPGWNPPAFNPPDFQMHNPFENNNPQNGNS